MRKLVVILSLLALMLPGSINAAYYGTYQINGWEVDYSIFGGTGEDVLTGITKTDDGGYLISGYTNSRDGDLRDVSGPSSSSGDSTILIKTDSLGKKQWVKKTRFVGKIRNSTDGKYILYSKQGAVKIDSGGNILWEFLPTYPQYFNKIAVTSDGGFVGISYYGEQIKVGGISKWRPLVIKVNSNGEVEWRSPLTVQDNLIAKNNSFSIGVDLVASNDGNILVGFQTNKEVFDQNDILSNLIGVQTFDLNSQGEILKTKAYYGTDKIEFTRVTNDAEGNIYLFSEDGYAKKINGDGKLIWQKKDLKIRYDSEISITGEKLYIFTPYNGDGLFAGGVYNLDGQQKAYINYYYGDAYINESQFVQVGSRRNYLGHTDNIGYPGETNDGYLEFGYLIKFGLEPTFSTPTKTADGFTIQVNNYDPSFNYDVSTIKGNVTINKSGLITLTGLNPGQSSTVTVVTTRNGYGLNGALVDGTAQIGTALTPTFGVLSKTKTGFTVQLKNYDSSYSFVVSTTKGSIVISKTGLITVTGLTSGQSATVSVSTSRPGYSNGKTSVTGSSLVGSGLTPTFGQITKTSTGFTVKVSNYSSAYGWKVSTTSGKVSINSSGLITVTGLSKGKSATVSLTTSRAGYNSGTAKVTGSAK